MLYETNKNKQCLTENRHASIKHGFTKNKPRQPYILSFFYMVFDNKINATDISQYILIYILICVSANI